MTHQKNHKNQINHSSDNIGGMMKDEMELPKGWAEIDLGFFMKRGTGSVDPSKYKNEVFELFSIPAYDIGKAEIIEGSQIGSSKKVVTENDVLLSRIVPHIQRSWIVGKSQGYRQIGSSEWIIFDGSSINTKYLRLFLMSYGFHMKFMKTISGVGGSLTRANPNETAQFNIPLPPLPEQHRIVSKIEELFSSLDKGIESLKTAQAQLKVYRQAVLKWAFEGKLSRLNRDSFDFYDNHDAATQVPNNHSNQKNQKNHSSDNGELPEGWEWKKLGSIADKVTDGEHITPKRTTEGVYLLSARNVQNGFISLENVDYIPESEYQRIIKRCNPEEGDILISCSGSVGRVSRVPKNLKFTLVRSVALVKLDFEKYDSKYFQYLLLSPVLQAQIEDGKKATAQANLFLGPIKNLDVLIPETLTEQQGIVSEIESRLSVCDKIEESISVSLLQAEALRQSILKKAFEGKLVPQDPNDEPAGVLLGRIRGEREREGKEKSVVPRPEKTLQVNR